MPSHALSLRQPLSSGSFQVVGNIIQNSDPDSQKPNPLLSSGCLRALAFPGRVGRDGKMGLSQADDGDEKS